ncbi:MAG: hypothetical protein IPH06_01620 [Alphaproteobacteria bacterium]|jgi:ATP-dependent RNA helicase SUPV3L1/SUV3|nr:hypothetical protein [Alphaproteobacteria bacterium]QQS56754.1 MAG: hypothetical protein IPN28_10875 [Alphaproteobacteria bacterium]
MLNSKPSQFSLSADGTILWQSKPENPLPGEPVAKLVKGDHALRPAVEILANEKTAGVDAGELLTSLQHWLNTHIASVLEPLVVLGAQVSANDSDPVQAISKALFDSLGVVPREELEESIGKLDAEQRGVLRSKKIRLGPLLVFMPLLNKPAAVRLRGLLWSLYRERPLPAPVPADGIVSRDIDEASADRDFFRSIGYPVYGGRIVRIDMLDRVINAIYDHATKGKFSARHEMAEWLGCSIEGLYKILEAMGHMKIYDPAEDPEKIAAKAAAAAEAEVAKAEASPVSEVSVAAPAETDASAPATTEIKAEKVAEVKPELAVFRLKKGKAFEGGRPAHGHLRRKNFVKGSEAAGPEPESGGEEFKKPGGGKKFSGDKKDKWRDDSGPDHFSRDKRAKKKRFKDRDGHKDHVHDGKDRPARIIAFEAKRKEEDSPFAILQKLKTKADE